LQSFSWLKNPLEFVVLTPASSSPDPDESFMQAALVEARRGSGQTSPNPAVGAVIVKEGAIIARGWHRQAGLPHAEIEALRALVDPADAAGATLYVTLEPCSTHGRTPPCAEAIIRAGFRRVVIGTLDPNPAHAGRAIAILNQAGIEVRHGVLEDECRRLNLAFNHWIVTGMPWVLAKAGLTLDGRITRPPGESRWITNPASRADTHEGRARVDAILIGGGTLRSDNPQLTVRGVPGARQPWRVVVSQSGNLPGDATLFTDEHRERTLVFTGKPLRTVLQELGQRSITSVMIEGGTRILGEAFDERLVHEVCFYMAPMLSGGPNPVTGGEGVASSLQALSIVNPHYTRLGDDLRMSGEVSPIRPS
jgi:diaminohydroxyphosphoribosylaminopyrimidine deaminase/5-amino-6-(5-phosphoribosylamino)uracil reductase